MPRRKILACSLLLATLPCFAGSHARRGPTAQRMFGHKSRKTSFHLSGRPATQHEIDDARATQIQSALTSAGYLSVPASGHWDAQTESAMQQYQANNGWQTKIVPDSRAIIKLGLGPTGSEQASVEPRRNAQTGSF